MSLINAICHGITKNTFQTELCCNGILEHNRSIVSVISYKNEVPTKKVIHEIPVKNKNYGFYRGI